MKSVMQHRFSEVPDIKIPRSSFNRSHGVKTTFDGGYLVPIMIDEALPGDTFKVRLHGFARLSTPKYPVMDNLFMDTFFFAVPNRLLWENWDRFMGERRPDPDTTISLTLPVIDDAINEANNTLFDYMGLPTLVNQAGLEFSALPFRAYNLIWNEWFRDQNLQDSVTWGNAANGDDGPDNIADYVLLKRNKRPDYFTSALPWLQKGDAVELSLGTTAPIFGDNMDWDNGNDNANWPQVHDAAGSANLRLIKHDGGGNTSVYGGNAASGTGELLVDLGSATASTVNELRQAIQVQRILERDARAGSRYTEIIESHFGVKSPDGRQQRPEYLGGGSTPVIVKPIADTASGAGAGTGELGAYAVAGFNNHGFTKSFTEHCTIIGLVNVRADLTYQEGMDRMWSRSTRYDFYWPSLAHLGEQAILNKEIYVDAADLLAGTTDDVFGYQERYAEYRYKKSMITGMFRSNDAASLDAWHLGIEFGATPTLDDTFCPDSPPIDRVIVTPAEPHFIFDGYCQMECVRPMPVYSVPGLIDHF